MKCNSQGAFVMHSLFGFLSTGDVICSEFAAVSVAFPGVV